MANKSLTGFFQNPLISRYLTLGLQILGILFIVLAIWLPRRIQLNRAVVTDEVLWLNRSKDFYMALKENNLGETYQKQHPGVTAMWLGSRGIQRTYQEYREALPELGEQLTIKYYLREIFARTHLENLVGARIVMSAAHTLALILAFWYAWRMLGPLPAFVGFLLIAFDPFHLALTRLLHLDGLLSNLYLLTLLAYICYLRERKLYDLILGALSMGLCMLTKTPGAILVPTIGVMILFDLWQKSRLEEKPPLAKRVWSYAWPLAVWSLVAAVVFYLLWPAMWVNPIEILTRVFIKMQTYATGGHSTPVFFNGQIVKSGELDLRYFYYYPYAYLWRTTPVVLLGLLAAVWGFFTRRKPFNNQNVRFVLFGLVIAVIIFTLVMTMGSKKFERYLLPVHAPLNIIAGIGWVAFAFWLKEKFSSRWVKNAVLLIVLFLAVGFQAFFALSIFPYNLAYYNPIMGGGQKAPEVLQIGWGEGIDQAALYLNQKENPEDLTVLSWYAWGSLSYFLKGEAIFVAYDWPETLQQSDYLVVYIHQWQRDIPGELLDFIADWQPEHTIWINDIEYVQIYKIRP